MIKAADLIEKVRYALDINGGYIYTARGQVWTQAAQDRATRAGTPA